MLYYHIFVHVAYLCAAIRPTCVSLIAWLYILFGLPFCYAGGIFVCGHAAEKFTGKVIDPLFDLLHFLFAVCGNVSPLRYPMPDKLVMVLITAPFIGSVRVAVINSLEDRKSVV